MFCHELYLAIEKREDSFKMPIYKKVNKEFFKIWTPQMAYVLGFFAADGNMIQTKRGARFISLQITDKEILYAIRAALCSDHSISHKAKGGNESDVYRLQIGSKEMFEDLLLLGFLPNKTKRLKLPLVPPHCFADFVRGYFDGDGNVWVGDVHKERRTKTRVISTVFTSCSKEFLESLQKMLSISLNDMKGSLKPKSGCNAFILRYSIYDSLKLYNFMYNRENLSISGLYLERKKKVFEEYLKKRL